MPPLTSDTTPVEVGEFLGVDLGIAQLATDSDGNNYSRGVEQFDAATIATVNLSSAKAPKGAKRLSILAGREAAFRRHHNHCISKAIVQCAKDTSRVIAVEELTGIRERVTVRRKISAASWDSHFSFAHFWSTRQHC